MPADDLNGLIAWLKSNPDKTSMGIGTVAGLAYIACVFFQKQTGTRFGLVPYRGGAPALQDVVADRCRRRLLNQMMLM
jgi:tripartite-type tricarboxylate transporter receptor subunit TctC